MMKPFFRHSIFKPIALMGVCLLVAACSGPKRPKPADIPAVQVLQDIRLKWSADAVKQYQKAWKGLEPSAEYRRLVAVKLAALGADPEDATTQETKK